MAPIIFLILLFIIIKLAIRSEKDGTEKKDTYTMHTFNRKRSGKNRKTCKNAENKQIENNSNND